MKGGGAPRVVVITGASAGVGRATARAFAAEGARIGLLARGEAGLARARRDVEAAAVEREFGPIDVWINNAMTSVFSPVKEMTPDEFRRVTEVTYLGVVHGTMAALRRMLPRDRGAIVQVGSALAYRDIPLQAAYCGAKHAIQGFTESLRAELIHDGSGVRLTMVRLPPLNTPLASSPPPYCVVAGDPPSRWSAYFPWGPANRDTGARIGGWAAAGAPALPAPPAF